ncbi:MAG: hypothetical protein ACODAF_06390 [Actinomycetota bacterium]
MKPRLSMRAWTERQGTGDDPFGGGGDWSDVLTDEPCWWWSSSGQEAIDPQRAVAIGGEHVMFDVGTDVAAGDRVRKLVDDRGVTVWNSADASGLAREVEHVGHQRDHVAVTLRSTS